MILHGIEYQRPTSLNMRIMADHVTYSFLAFMKSIFHFCLGCYCGGYSQNGRSNLSSYLCNVSVFKTHSHKWGHRFYQSMGTAALWCCLYDKGNWDKTEIDGSALYQGIPMSIIWNRNQRTAGLRFTSSIYYMTIVNVTFAGASRPTQVIYINSLIQALKFIKYS